MNNSADRVIVCPDCLKVKRHFGEKRGKYTEITWEDIVSIGRFGAAKEPCPEHTSKPAVVKPQTNIANHPIPFVKK
jgi:hypothetical protein